MLIPNETNKTLQRFAKSVIKDAKGELSRQKKNTSGKLSKSLAYQLNVSKNSFGLSFLMEDYGEFVDRGVSGFLTKYDTPYSYKDKWPPLKKLDRWIVKKGLSPRGENGQFMSRKSLQFLISRKIFFHGMKPSHFISKPFEKHFRKLPDEIIEAFGLDVEKFYEQTLK